ncbi:Protein EMSY [Toxocara canis]|uniref:Protein EMSY n=1 Tax=Toxocara canis TaxID=6265 RepID=A0A0B2V3F5_TOXCA|nr:Protein EMSY [Toxocara canis]
MTAPDVHSECTSTDNVRGISTADLDEEDCAYLLKSLEVDAFSCVVNAMRAQGMLTEYKELLLDHLKSALFISDSFYKSEIRRAAHNDVLCRIAHTLNPSYDTYTEWGSIGNVPCPPLFSETPLYDEHDVEGLDVADQLLKLANSHNSTIDSTEAALLELIDLPKTPFVKWQKLRAILRETESSAEERVDVSISSDNSVHSVPMLNKMSNATLGKRGRKARVDSSRPPKCEVLTTEDEKQERYISATIDQDDLHMDGASRTEKKGAEMSTADGVPSMICQEAKLEQNSAVEMDGVVGGGDGFVVHRPPGVLSPPVAPPSSFSAVGATLPRSTAAILRPTKLDKKKSTSYDEQGDITGAEEEKPRRRRSKPRDNASCVCARVMPFIFEAVGPGQRGKPPRGNPDRRTAKRPSPTSAPAFSSSAQMVNATVAGLPTMPQQFFSRLLIKRARTTSASGEQCSPSENGAIVYARSLVSASSLAKAQLPAPRTYMRPGTATKFFVSSSQAASAYSNPTRPYYGNPSAAAMGITVRGSALGNGLTAAGASASTAIPEKLSHSPQNGQIGEVQHMAGHDYSTQAPVLVPAAHQQLRTVRRQSFSSAKSGYAVSGSSAVRLVAPVANSLNQGSSAGNHGQQLLQATIGPSSHRPASSQSSHSPLPSPSGAPTRLSAFSMSCIQHMTAANQGIAQMQETADALADVNSILPDQASRAEDTNEMVKRMDEDETAPDVERGSSISEGVRLECDEVMIPEQRCVVTALGSGPITANHLSHHITPHSASISQRVQPMSLVVGYADGEEEAVARSHRLIPQEYVNGVIQHDGHDTVGLVPTGHCLR